MLVLTRRLGESIVIDGQIRLTPLVISRHGDAVRIGIVAPPDVRVDREEVHRRKVQESATPANDLPVT